MCMLLVSIIVLLGKCWNLIRRISIDLACLKGGGGGEIAISLSSLLLHNDFIITCDGFHLLTV